VVRAIDLFNGDKQISTSPVNPNINLLERSRRNFAEFITSPKCFEMPKTVAVGRKTAPAQMRDTVVLCFFIFSASIQFLRHAQNPKATPQKDALWLKTCVLMQGCVPSGGRDIAARHFRVIYPRNPQILTALNGKFQHKQKPIISVEGRKCEGNINRALVETWARQIDW
jgi:hypothetical protein